MAGTPYKPVLWGDEPGSKDKLNTMANNDQYLFEHLPIMNFNTYGVQKTSGVKMLAGIANLPPTNGPSSSSVFNFGTFFSSGCRPVVVTGTQPSSGRWRYFITVTGVDGYIPDNRGVKVSLFPGYYSSTVKNIVDGRTYVHLMAMGW